MTSFFSAHAYLLILVFLGVLEAAIGKFSSPKGDSNETAVDAVSFALHLLVRPVVYGLIFAIALALTPESRGAFKDWPWFAWLPIFLIGEDMVQYWWHRLGHTQFGWLWHRAHHSAPYMGVRITFRNGLLYQLLMPNVWTGAVFLFLGADGFAAAYGLAKFLVVSASHSEVRWDQFLYRYKILSPLAWIVERTLSTPATHFSHHALSEADGIGHYSGNFGNLLFFWDVLFGTALITRKYPPAFGVENDLHYGRERWPVQLFFPLFQPRREASEFNEPDLWFRRGRTGAAPAE
jgi:sterol desaturase/sphingolipid hydroxylase (fatty acid hydroxylase superfamily)